MCCSASRPGPRPVGRVTVNGSGGIFRGTDSGHCQDAPGRLRDRAARQPRARPAAEKVSEAEPAFVPGRDLRAGPIVRKRNTVDYTFDIDPGPKVEIAVEGFKISRCQLKKNVPVYEENALDDDLLNEGRRNLLNYMQGRGYFDAKVTVKKNPVSAGELRVTYVIDAGRAAQAGEAGDHRQQDLQRGTASIAHANPAGRTLSAHGRFSQSLLNADVRNLIANPYRANGFLDVKITPKVEDNYQGKENDLAITLQIEEGPQTMVGTLQIVGNETALTSPFPDLNISPGQAFGYSKINEDREIVLNYYFNNGFPNATFEASAKPSPTDPNRMDVTYTIHEGEQVIVDQVFTAGLNHTRPFVVQREIQIKPGDPLSQIDMLNTQKRLYDLGIFSQVDTAVQNPESSEREKNVW